MQKADLEAGRPRAAANAPIAALAERADELTGAWLAQLVSVWPLNRMGEVPLSDLALAGPGVCEATLRALVSDTALASISEAAAALRGLPPELAVRTVEAVRRALWVTLLAECRGAAAVEVAELADRLGHVCSALLAASFAPLRDPDLNPPSVQVPVLAPRPRRLQDARSALDGKPGEGKPWLEAIGRQVALRPRNGRPFAVLLIELDGRERLIDGDLNGDADAALARAERILLERLRPGDELRREQPGRYWVIVPDTDSGGAHQLAWELSAGLREVEGHRGAELRFAVGIALCPVDGELASTLAEHAESALFAARAGGAGMPPG